MCSPPSARQVARFAARLSETLRRFGRHDGGATAIEYGLVCTFVALATIGAMRLFGSAMMEAFPKLAEFPTVK